jgi:hypothetical protein
VFMVFDGFTEAWKCQLFAPRDNGHRDWKLKCPLMTQSGHRLASPLTPRMC